MKKAVCISLLFLAAGCGRELNKRISLWRNDRIPYGTYYAYQHLPYLFTDALIETTRKSPVSLYALDESKAAYLVIGSIMKPDEKEWKALLNYVYAGNQVFISAIEIGNNVLDSLGLAVAPGDELFDADSMTLSLQHPQTGDSLAFSYPGAAFDSHFTGMDSSVTEILGKDAAGKANFVKLGYEGGGALYVHLAPLAFSNFFLLHKQNKSYYDLALSAIPDTVNTVRWDDYFRHHINGTNSSGKSEFSKLGVFLSHPVLSWAFWLSILLFGTLYLFESKRRQRVVPVRRALQNTSLDFVKTIGRLYYQRRDNQNLAAKMSTHFLDHVRTRYNLSTSRLDDAFAASLAYKSGYPVPLVQQLIGYISGFGERQAVTDDELLAFNDAINQFHQQT